MIDEMIEFYKTQQAIDSENLAFKEIDDKFEEEIWEVEKEYDAKIRALNDARNNAINEKRKEQNKVKYEHDEKIRNLNTTLKNINEIVEFMTAKNITQPVTEDELYYYKYGQKKTPLFYSEFMENDALTLRACIIENDKPTNKYSLGIVGHAKFDKQNTYGTGLHTSNKEGYCHYFTVDVVIKDAPDVESLIEYYEKNVKDGLRLNNKTFTELKRVIEANNEKEAKTKEFKAKFSLSDFDPILSVRCEHCNEYAKGLDMSYYYENERGYISEEEMSKRLTCPYCGQQMTKIQH